jgi:hypothetical protein
MRMYGKRFLKRARERSIDLHTETMDSQVFTINDTAKYCEVKIQGSDTKIRAWYPENWTKRPIWLRVGQSVKIMHTGGHRGRIEVIGSGLVVPDPYAGGDEPEQPDLDDIILSGLQIMTARNRLRNAIYVTTGSVSINGIEYAFAEVETDNEVLQIGDGGTIGEFAEVLDGGTIAEDPTPTYPYWPSSFGHWVVKFVYADATHIWIKDMITPFSWIDPDRILTHEEITVQEGVPPIDTNPPSDAVQLGWIFVPQIPLYADPLGPVPVASEYIYPWMINYVPQPNPDFAYCGRPPGEIRIIGNNQTIVWGDTGAKSFTLRVYDIFGIEAILATNTSIKAEIVSGTGNIRGTKGPWNDTECITLNHVGNYVTENLWGYHNNQFPWLEYKRDGLATDISPVIKLTLECNVPVIAYIYVILLDALGNPMYPEIS